MATKLRRIVITLPARTLKDVHWLAPLEDITRDELISEALKRFLKPHLEIRAQVSKAAKQLNPKVTKAISQKQRTI